MPWGKFALNDGHEIPAIAFGTWTRGNGDGAITFFKNVLSLGYEHIDTAQMYGNEIEAGKALKDCGLAREDVYVTTKWSATDGLDIPTSIDNSLRNLGISYVDLYLIHFPWIAKPDIPSAWAQMEKVKADGKAKSIGISNFGVADMQVLLSSAKVKPAVNQIPFNPYQQQIEVRDFAKKKGIVIEAYSVLAPVTQPGGPLDKPLKEVAEKLNVTSDQVLVAWAKAKGVVPVMSSSKEWRLKGYFEAADIKLTPADIKTIDSAGMDGKR